MTDNEIIKSLECCSNSYDDGFAKCDECPRFAEESGCTLKTMKDALNLINRQNAEIERWKKDKYLIKENGEIELVPRTDIEEVKAEAIKEFAERLTDIIQENVNRSLDNPNGFDYYPIDVFKDIDNLVKEMAEEK